jgi:GNAT superfamily N-acetyltransferase
VIGPVAFQDLVSSEEIDRLALGDLSEWFNPFLPHFIREAHRCGGEVLVAREGPEVRGLYLYSPAERLASAFTRSRSIAEQFRTARDPPTLFAPFALAPGAETYHIYQGDLVRWSPSAPFLYRPHLARPGDLPEVVRLLRDVYGGVDEQWFATLPSELERCFVVRIEGEIAGVAWASYADGHGRLHSLSVRPRFRRLGIGTDLWTARALWLKAAGAHSVIAEISDRNAASRAVSEHGGMRPVGRWFRNERASAPRV